MFGQQGFESSQNDYCVCIPHEDVSSHYTKLIDDFYESNVPAGQYVVNFILKYASFPL